MGRLLHLRVVWIAAAALVAVTVSAVGLYVHLRPQPAQPRLSAPPTVSVGAKTVTKAGTAEHLAVIQTDPVGFSSGVPLNTTITMSFNLPVDPVTARSYFSVLPATDGSFTQGPTAQDFVFTPDAGFAAGASVNVVLRQGFTSRDGTPLEGDYSLSFVTAVSSRNVLFLVGYETSRVYSAQSGQSVTVQTQFGDKVPADISVDIFKATALELMTAQEHDGNGAYLDRRIDTGSMQLVSHQVITNSGSFQVAEPDGIYLLLAADSGGQYGAMWLGVSKYGVVLRQDDQKIVVAGEDLTTGATDVTFSISFYNLQTSVQIANVGGTFTGTGEFAIPYQTRVDVAVAASNGEELVIPVWAPQTNADLKALADLSQAPQIFLTTDRAGYQQGDTVRFGGVVRLSNDQLYSLPAGMAISVWSGVDPNAINVPVASDGTFGGSFAMPGSAFNSDGSDGQLYIYARSAYAPKNSAPSTFTVVDAIGPHSPAARITVSFDKATYIAGDTINASIAGVDSSGTPLAGKALSLTIYSQDHPAQPSEIASYATPSAWGDPVQQNIAVNLDATGKATYSFKANGAGKSADQEVTLVATYATGVAAAVGARTAVVYQAADEVLMLFSRSIYQPGDAVIAPFVVETTAGQRVPNAPVAYELDQTAYNGSTATTTVIASGTLTTDANGLGAVRATYSWPTGQVDIKVKGKDAAGNVFAATKPVTVTNDLSSLVNFGVTDTLQLLSVTTDKIAYDPGDTAHLTITAPAAEPVLLSLERGRLYQYRWVNLAKGDNPFDITVSPDLGPGFSVMFSYFRNGHYVNEGIPISVSRANRVLTLSVTADHSSYTAGQTAHVSVTVTDSSGAPVAASFLIDGYDASMSAYKLVDQGSIAGAFFTPGIRGTNGSSSLLGIGFWGGRCGGGLFSQPAITRPGQTAVWLTDLTTDAAGHATVDVPIAHGTVRLALFAASPTTSVGQAQIDLHVP